MSTYEDDIKNKWFPEKKSDEKVQPFESYEPEWITLDKITCKSQPWFWPGMIPNDTVTLFAGVGGIGKSLLLIDIIAKTTTGEKFNAGGFEHQLPQGNVILLSAEDDPEYHIKPKVIAANGNPSLIYFLKSKVGKLSNAKKFLELDKDLFMLEQKLLSDLEIKLIIIDPIAYFVGELKENLNSDVANFIQKIIDMSKKYHVATIFNKHLRKQATGAKGRVSAAEEVGGASSWTNTPRKCWLITDYPDDNEIKVITGLKDNLNKKSGQSLGYKIVPAIIEENALSIETTKLEWIDKMLNITSNEALNEDAYEKSKLQQAVDFIYNHVMENGASVVKYIEELALAQGIKKKTFRNAYEEFEKIYDDELEIKKGSRGTKTYMFKSWGV